jgi:nucleoside-diphosphate-sugar epimerase
MSTPRKRTTIFLTGASGFLGRNLLESFARERPEASFLVLARPAAAPWLQKRFHWIEPRRFKLLLGDISQPALSLNAADRAEVLDQASEVWHLAASTSIDDRRVEDIRRANVGGTRHLIEFARQIRHLEGLYFTSTAYIVGTNRPAPPEDELPPATRFNNTYEATKWEAEKLVRDSGLPFTIFRPSIILDCSDGSCEGEARAMYGYVLAVYRALSKHFRSRGLDIRKRRLRGEVLELDFRLIGSDPATKNYVCVDDVVRTILSTLKTSHRQRTFNLTNARPLFVYEVGQAIETALGVKGLRYVGEAIENPTPAEKSAVVQTRPFAPYTLRSDPEWPTANTDSSVEGNYSRLRMTPSLFTFLLKSYADQCLFNSRDDIPVPCR